MDLIWQYVSYYAGITGGRGIMILKPTQNNVVVRYLEQEEKTAGGLFLPNTVNGQRDRVEVIAVGPKVEFLSAGDTVIISPATKGVEIDNMLIIKDAHILARVASNE
jgi:chaperonin GroES